jgi:hypothetical protein
MSKSLLPGRSATVRGELREMWEQAAVPGSSLPSGQSQKSSLTAEKGILTEGFEIQVKVVESWYNLETEQYIVNKEIPRMRVQCPGVDPHGMNPLRVEIQSQGLYTHIPGPRRGDGQAFH